MRPTVAPNSRDSTKSKKGLQFTRSFFPPHRLRLQLDALLASTGLSALLLEPTKYQGLEDQVVTYTAIRKTVKLARSPYRTLGELLESPE